MTVEFRKKLIDSVCVSSFFSLTLFLFGPALIYFGNILEYPISFSAISPLLIATSCVSILLLAALVVSLKAGVHQKAVSLLFALSALLWIQGNLLVWNYGLLDGKDINWSAHRAHGFIDSALWLSLLLISFFTAERIHRVSRKASLAFISIELAAVVFTAAKAPDASHSRSKAAQDETPIYQFSAEKNVVILTLDGFQGDVFQEILDEEDSYRGMFRGFTYYRNALGGYPATYASVPLILTGQYYDNFIPAAVFLKNAYSKNSVPRVLKDQGYRVDLIGRRGIYKDDSVADSWLILSDFIEKNASLREASFLLDLSLFRHVPHFLKQYVYNNQSWLFSTIEWDKNAAGFAEGSFTKSVEIMKRLAWEADTSSKKRAFKYIHVSPPHPPIRMNERMEYVQLPFNRENFKTQAKGALELTSMFLRKLEALGIYDQTMIFVIGDHGQSEDWPLWLEHEGASEGGVARIPMLQVLKNSALPLFLVKPFQGSGELQISDAPVCLSDIPKTIFTELDFEAEDHPGVSVFKLTESDKRKRRYFFYNKNWSENQHYLQPLKEYYVTGVPWLDSSWQPTYKVYTSNGVKTVFPEIYRYGEPITFGEKSNSLAYQGEGWSLPRKDFTSTDDFTASLTVPAPPPRADLELKVAFMPFLVPGKLERQTVRISAGGKPLGEWVASEPGLQIRTMIIPRACVTDNVVEITFELPDAASPQRLGLGQDERNLALAVYSITLTESQNP